jgi:hypothetical protein
MLRLFFSGVTLLTVPTCLICVHACIGTFLGPGSFHAWRGDRLLWLTQAERQAQCVKGLLQRAVLQLHTHVCCCRQPLTP